MTEENKEVRPFRLVVCVRCAQVRLAGSRNWMSRALFDEVYAGDERIVDSTTTDGACPTHRSEQTLDREFESGDTTYIDDDGVGGAEDAIDKKE